MPARIHEMMAEAFLPEARSLAELREAAMRCRGCPLYESATQTVFGEGPASCDWLLVGEQPGDQEDKQGRPFVGPAGKLLDRALSDLGIVRERVYVTNAVKHFKWSPKGKRRIHETPRAGEIRACAPWLEAELETVRPRVIGLLGSTAVRSILGAEVKVMADRGRIIESNHGPCLVTVHPSSLLRAQDPSQREAGYEAFLSDLKQGIAFLERTA